jgi:hypothetical protein
MVRNWIILYCKRCANFGGRVRHRGEEVFCIRLDSRRTSLISSGMPSGNEGISPYKRTHEHEDCSCVSLTQRPIIAKTSIFSGR